jgi:ATP-binding cassette, subfamily F, member 3
MTSLANMELAVEPEPQRDNVESIRTSEVMRAFLDSHIADLDPRVEGSGDHSAKMGDAVIGVIESNISRTDPALAIKGATLRRGESKILIGPNGSGKSTFFDAIMELDASLSTREGKGLVQIGNSVHGRDKLRIARLDQEETIENINEVTTGEALESAIAYFKAQLPVDWENYSAGGDDKLYEQNLRNQAAHERIEEMRGKFLKLFEMDSFLDRKTSELSGGERTKLALAIVLVSEPDVMLLDEPTNHLDLESISKLTGLFKVYQRAGVGMISSSHVPWFLSQAAEDGILEIQWDGKKRELSQSNSSYEGLVRDRSRKSDPIMRGDIEWGEEWYNRKKGSSVISTPPRMTLPNSPLIETEMPSISGGDLVVLSGSNGSGKTKLMEALTNKKDKPNLPHAEKGVQIAYLPQFWPESINDGSIADFFDWIKSTTAPHCDIQLSNFAKVVRKVDFGGKNKAKLINIGWMQKTPLATLSGGEQRLLWFLAVNSLERVDVLMLDEPTNHMDRSSQGIVQRAIQTFSGAVIISSHDRELMDGLSKSGGNKDGFTRAPVHIVLEKKGGVTHSSVTDRSPSEYAAAVIAKAQKQARRIRK